MSEEVATGQTGVGSGGGADEAMSVDSGMDGSGSVTSPGSTVSDFSDHPSESGSLSSTITGKRVDEFSVDSGIPGEEVDTTAKTEQWVEESIVKSKESSIMSDEGATGGGADEAMAVDSGIESSSNVASPVSTVSHFSDHPSESGSGSSTISGTVYAPGHQQNHGSGISSFHGNSEQHSVRSNGTSGHGQPGHSQRPGQTMTFPDQRVDQSSVDSGIFTGTTPGSASNPNLPGEKVDTAARTEQWVEESFEVFVKNLDGKIYTIEVNLDEEVTTFRRKVCQRLGVPGEQHRLTLQEGRTLEDGRKLRDYPGFKKHCTVYCQGRLRGGQGF